MGFFFPSRVRISKRGQFKFQSFWCKQPTWTDQTPLLTKLSCMTLTLTRSQLKDLTHRQHPLPRCPPPPRLTAIGITALWSGLSRLPLAPTLTTRPPSGSQDKSSEPATDDGLLPRSLADFFPKEIEEEVQMHEVRCPRDQFTKALVHSPQEGSTTESCTNQESVRIRLQRVSRGRMSQACDRPPTAPGSSSHFIY